MNPSLASHLHEVTAPLAESSVPLAPGNTFDPGDQPANKGEALAPLLWPAGQVLDHRYRIGRLIQIGGMASVYEATQLDLVRRVAIKVPTPECAADSACTRRFEREARTLARLQHPHIVSVFALGSSKEGAPYMAMELVVGPTLRAHLIAERTLPWRVAVEFGAQLADALEFAHASGVVHGDVSSSNVLLKRRGDTFVAKLIDFGAARRIDDPSLPHRTFGTRRYVAPELLRGEASSIASDVFALGAMLKEMLGEAAFVTSLQPLRQLMASMLDSDPQGRPKSAGEVARRLRATLALQPATPRRWRKSRLAVLVSGAATFVLVTYFHERKSVAGLPEVRVAVAPQVAPAQKESGAALKAARLEPRPPEAVPMRSPVIAPIASNVEQRDPEREVVPEPAPAPPQEVSDQLEIVASLDRWLDTRNPQVSGDSVELPATRVGEPRISFGPGGTCASVRYFKRPVSARSDRDEESVVEQQEFFARVGDSWQIITRGHGM
jgi:tRNA A-37 threonylcarbamoyl transferase component Bud32